MAKQHEVGVNYTPAYQISGIPFVTGSATGEVPEGNASAAPDGKTLKISFPYVTKFFQIQNRSAGNRVLRVGFTAEGANGNIERGAQATPPRDKDQGVRFFTVGANETSVVYNLRTRDLFFSCVGGTGEVGVVAGLTMIGTGSFPILSSSLSFRGV